VVARQADAGCSDDYRVRPGDPCVPVAEDVDCAELRAEGVEDIAIVGEDVYGLDNGGEEGVACESPPTSGTGAPRDGGDRIDLGSFAIPVGLAVTLVIGVGAAALLVRHYRGTTEDAERRSIQVAVYGALAFGAVAIALGILGWA